MSADVTTIDAADDTGRAPLPAVYTVKEAAALLSLSLNSTYMLCRAGEIPAVKLGGRWVVPRQRFHEWLNQAPAATNLDEDAERR